MKGKNKVTAGVLAIVLGAYGAQYFYMGNTEKALLRLLLSIFIPVCAVVFEIMGIVEGVKILSMSDEEFAERFYELRGEMTDAGEKEPSGSTADATDYSGEQKQKPVTPSGFSEQFGILRTYKELLDCGAITEQEFSAIKSSVMRW